MCKSTKDFLDIENEHREELLSLDSEVTKNFVEAPNALSLCFQKAKEGEASLPTEEEFIALQKSMGTFEVGREGLPPLDQGKEIGSSNLWDAEKLEGVENNSSLNLLPTSTFILIDLVTLYLCCQLIL